MTNKADLVIVFALLTSLTFAFSSSIRTVSAQSTVSIETELFTHSLFVPPQQVRAPYIDLVGGTNVRITFTTSTPIDLFCQNSWEYNQSSLNGWHDVYSHWSEKTASMNRTYIVPTTDTWYFTLVNYDSSLGVDVYNIKLYRIETYEINLETSKPFYDMGEQATITASVTRDGAALSGVEVMLQVSGPHGEAVLSQINQTDSSGRINVDLVLPLEYGTFNVTAQAEVAGKTIEDSATFDVAEDTAPPVTFDDYDGSWHTVDFTITLTAHDNESGILETYYQINSGPIHNVSASGQPLITVENANNTLEYWSRDKAGNEEAPHKTLTKIKLDKTAPAGSVLINESSGYTNLTLVNLTLSASDSTSGIAQVQFSNDNITWTAWEPYGSIKPWTLQPDEGQKTVYARFKNEATLVSDTISEAVILDTTPPMIGNMSRIPEGYAQPAQAMKITVSVTDTISGVKNVMIAYTTNNSLIWIELPMSPNPATGFYERSLPGQPANTRVDYRIAAYDNAGNHEIEDNEGQFYAYTVIPELFSIAVLALSIATASLITLLCKKTKKLGRH